MRALLFVLLVTTASAAPPPSLWETLEPGLDFATFDAPTRSDVGDSGIRVLRIDLDRFEPVLVAAGELGTESATARGWVESQNLVAAINASMYAMDHRTSVSLMRSGDYVNNPRRSKDKDFLVLGPKAGGGAGATILDVGCDDVDAALPRWTTVVQSIRMLSCDGRNVWSQQPKRWSHAAIGVDGAGRLLFVHARSPWSTHDFIDNLRALPLDLKRLQYAEGGPEAQLFVRSGDFGFEGIGSFETGFYESDDNDRAWPVPNVIGIRRKPASIR